jgi:ribose transport system ATP-binding protein
VLKDGRKVHDGATAETTPAGVARMMVGRSIEDSVWASTSNPAAECLRISDTRIGKLAVPDLVVHKGEVVGLAGVLGAGQTEILEALAGAGPKPVGGEFLVNGRKGCPHSVAEAIERGVYLVSDDRLRKALFPGLSVEENLLSATLRRTSRFGFMQTRRSADAGRSTIERLGIKCDGADQDVFQLSGGNQQKVTFGRWLIRLASHAGRVDPLILLDNPTEGVDVGSKAEIYKLVRELTEAGASVLVSSAEFPEMLKLCDRIYCIADHAVGECLDRSEFSEERLLLQVN